MIVIDPIKPVVEKTPFIDDQPKKNRISVIPSDPGYDPNIPKLKRYKVIVDGEEVRRCYTADENTGLALVGIDDDFGRPIVNDEIVRDWITGEVQIIPMHLT